MKPLIYLSALLVALLLARLTNACEEYLFSNAYRLGTDTHVLAMVDGQEVGFCSYTNDGGRVYIEFLQVDAPYKRNGISTRLLGKMIERERPREIQAVMAFDNWSAASQLFSEDIDNCRAMALATPFYKAASKFGFSEILECWANHWGFFEIVLTKKASE